MQQRLLGLDIVDQKVERLEIGEGLYLVVEEVMDACIHVGQLQCEAGELACMPNEALQEFQKWRTGAKSVG